MSNLFCNKNVYNLQLPSMTEMNHECYEKHTKLCCCKECYMCVNAGE